MDWKAADNADACLRDITAFFAQAAEIVTLFIESRDNGDNNDDEIDAMCRKWKKELDRVWAQK